MDGYKDHGSSNKIIIIIINALKEYGNGAIQTLNIRLLDEEVI